MAKTILVPTDFRIESLNTLKKALGEYQHDQSINVVLLYAEFLSDSIVDLLFYAPHKRINTLVSPEFRQALSMIENRYNDKIDHVRIELFHASNTNASNNFLEGKQIEEIYYPKSYRLKLSKHGFDPIPFLKKSKLPQFEIEWENGNNLSSEDNLATLFT